MAESNRTERRLLDSIRKAKTGPGDGAAEDASTGTARSTPTTTPLTPAPKTNRAEIPVEGATSDKRASSPAKSSPSKSSTSGPPAERPDTGLAGSRSEGRRATTRKVAERPPVPPKKTAQATASMDRYQSGGRVWPD